MSVLKFVAAPALRASLVRCAGKSSVQSQRRNGQLLARPITAVPHRPLHTNVRRLSTVASSIRYSAFLWFRDAGSAHLLHGNSLWPARRFGTLYQTAWEIRILTGTASDVCWRCTYLHCHCTTDADSIEHGCTVSWKHQARNLTKLYWPPRKHSAKRLIVLLEPKKWRGTTKKNLPYFQLPSFLSTPFHCRPTEAFSVLELCQDDTFY